MPSGIATSATAGASNPAAWPSIRAVHSTSGKVFVATAPRGLQDMGEGLADAGRQMPLASENIGALI